jgi:DNA mismatch repair protein MutS
MSTPMMKQYFEQKERYKDTLLFFRMGDFFELFFDDAVTAAKTLDIALTKRGKADGQEIPMCGVPAHSYEVYLLKLIRAGFKVAICDQLESPEEAKKRGYKEIVRREVIRVVTPGTITEETLLDSTKPNYLLAIASQGADFGISWVDISTAEFHTAQIAENQLASELARIKPSEILLPSAMLQRENLFELLAQWKKELSPQPDNLFEQKRAENKLKNFYKIISLEAFGALTRTQISASGVLLEYLELTQKEALPTLAFPKNFAANNYLQIDAAARRSLEIVEGDANLYRAINRTESAGGARLLYFMLTTPLRYAEGINARQNVTEFFAQNSKARINVRALLRQMPDLERAAGRVTIGRGLPRDMVAIRSALTLAVEIKEELIGQNLPHMLNEALNSIKPLTNLLALLTDAFREEAPVHLKDGNFIRAGYSSELDTLANIRDHSKRLVESLREQYAAETGVPNLKITYNNILGLSLIHI